MPLAAPVTRTTLPASDAILVELGYHRYEVRLDDALIGSEEAKIFHAGGGDNRPVGGIAQGWAKRGDLRGYLNR